MSRAKIVFTDTMIKKLKPETSEYRKSEGNGFTIRVMPSGFKSWLYLYVIDGRRRCLNLGQYPEVTLEAARDKFEMACKAVKNGIDPMAVAEQAEEERRTAPSVSELFEDYMRRHAKLNKRLSSCSEDQRLFRASVEPVWGKRKAATIKKRDCVELLDRYTDRPALCQNILSLMRKVYNFAVEKDVLEATPWLAVRAPVKVESRTRVLSDDEIHRLWVTELPKTAISDEIKRIIKLLLVTGQRVGEVCGICESEVDGRWWTIPAERSKSKVEHRVYLTDMAIQLLGQPANGYFFCSPSVKLDSGGNTIFKHIEKNAISHALRRNLKNYTTRRNVKVDKTCLVQPVVEDKKIDIVHFTPHDLRRTLATGLAKLGFHDEIIDAVTGHKKQGIVKIYNRYKYDAEKQQALQAWEKRLGEIIA